MATRHRARLWVQAFEDRRVPATFTVSNTLDNNTSTGPGQGDLRWCLAQANANPGADSIVFDSSFSSAQTITLTSALPAIAEDLTITGPGSSLLTVARDTGGASQFRIFAIRNPNLTFGVTMSGMKLTGGYCDATSQTDNGGAIYVGANDSLTLDSMDISGNTSTAQGGGIAMDERGRLTITNSTISGNVALGNEYGDPFTGFSGVGGGVYFTQDGSLTLLNSTVNNNVAKSSGAGVFLYGEASGTALIRNTTISTNTVTTPTTIIYRSGGAGIAVLTNSFAVGTGSYSLTIQNSTVTGNSAAGASYGGGIQLLASTLSSSSTNKITARIESSLIAGNSVGSGGFGADIFGAATAGFTAQKVTVDYSAIGSTTGFPITYGPGGVGSVQTGAFTLGPLLNNGGPTKTHLPPAGSPLIDKGSNPGALYLDQRGLSRYYTAGSSTQTVDIGSAEVQPAGVPTASGTAPTVTAAGGTLQTITVVYKDDTGITLSTIGNGDIQVTGPNSYSKTGTFVSKVGSGTSVTATYTVPAAGTGWTTTADGLYTISQVKNEVTDNSTPTALAVPAGAIGTFMVAIPRSIVVTTANDVVSTGDGKTSLREAITLANDVFPSNDTITFDPNVFLGGDIISWSSSLGQMFITDSVTIQGTGVTKLTFDGGSLTRHFNLDGPGVLNVTIKDVQLSGGRTSQKLQSERGGSIYNNGENLIMDKVWMIGNSAQQSYGGAVHIQGQGTLTFTNGRFNNNSSPNFAGGAVSALDPGHSISITNTLMIGNVGGYYGGAIFSSGGGSVSLNQCTVRINSTTLVIADNQNNTVITGGGGAIMVANGKIINGAVLEDFPTTSALLVLDSLFDGNTTAVAGGAIEFNGNTTGVLLRNSTFTNNSTTGNTQENVGGAVLVGNLHNYPVLIDNCTFAYNKAYSGGGLFVENDNTVSVLCNSSIFAQNQSADITQLPPDVDGAVTANNCFFGIVEGVGLQSGSANNIGNGSLGAPVDPLFDVLQNNGGPTDTLGLLAGSPCLDTGINPLNLAYDQRGVGYNRVSNGKADIGAFEMQVITAPTITSVVFGDGTVQRSLVKQIVVNFSEAVNFMGSVESAFTLTRTGTGGTVGNVTLSANPSTGPASSVTITFSGSFSEFGSLIDGLYDFKADAAQISGVGGALDGNNDLIPGGDYSVTGSTGNGFYRFFGDSDGDGTVSQSPDFIAFRNAFGLSSSIFDFNNNGTVDQLDDFVKFRNNFGLTP